ATQEDLAFVFGIYHRPQGVGHAVTRDDIARNSRGPFEVIGGARGHLIHEHLFGDTAAKQYGNGVEQTLFVHAVAVAFRQLHGNAQCSATRNNGDLVNGVSFGQATRHQGVASFVIGRVATLFFGHDERTALGTHDDFVFGVFKVVHVDRARIATGGEQGGLVDQVGQISTRKTGSATSQNKRDRK